MNVYIYVHIYICTCIYIYIYTRIYTMWQTNNGYSRCSILFFIFGWGRMTPQSWCGRVYGIESHFLPKIFEVSNSGWWLGCSTHPFGWCGFLAIFVKHCRISDLIVDKFVCVCVFFWGGNLPFSLSKNVQFRLSTNGYSMVILSPRMLPTAYFTGSWLVGER